MSLIKKLIDNSYFARYIFLNAVDIQDYQVFPSRAIQNSTPTFYFLSPKEREALTLTFNQAVPKNSQRQHPETIDGFLEHNGTVAFLMSFTHNNSLNENQKTINLIKEERHGNHHFTYRLCC